MKSKIRNIFLLLAPLLLLVYSCTPEHKLARNFISMKGQIHLEILTPEFVYKYNHKGEKIKDFKKMTGEKQDSALFYSSSFVQYTDDSIYLEKYVNSFVDEARKLGFDVYIDEAPDSILKQPQSYVLNMAQVQLDEYIYPHEDVETIGDTTYKKIVELNAVDASCWFELSKAGAENPKKTILYSSMTASDGFEGGFYIDPEELLVHYHYRLDTLMVKDIYDLAYYTGRRHAGYLFDYFMNNYIRNHMQGVQPQGYIRYDRRDRTLYNTEDERFEILSK